MIFFSFIIFFEGGGRYEKWKQINWILKVGFSGSFSFFLGFLTYKFNERKIFAFGLIPRTRKRRKKIRFIEILLSHGFLSFYDIKYSCFLKHFISQTLTFNNGYCRNSTQYYAFMIIFDTYQLWRAFSACSQMPTNWSKTF